MTWAAQSSLRPPAFFTKQKAWEKAKMAPSHCPPGKERRWAHCKQHDCTGDVAWPLVSPTTGFCGMWALLPCQNPLEHLQGGRRQVPAGAASPCCGDQILTLLGHSQGHTGVPGGACLFWLDKGHKTWHLAAMGSNFQNRGCSTHF